MGEIRDDAVLHLEVDRDGRAAELGMRRRRGVRMLQPADARDISGKAKNFRIVDVVDHSFPICRRLATSRCRSRIFLSRYPRPYIMLVLRDRQGSW